MEINCNNLSCGPHTHKQLPIASTQLSTLLLQHSTQLIPDSGIHAHINAKKKALAFKHRLVCDIKRLHVGSQEATHIVERTARVFATSTQPY